MSDGYKNGAFALGLVTGGGLVLNLFLWSAHEANNLSDSPPQGQEDSQGHPWISFWDWLNASFIVPEDTIAQWAMAVLSLAAVWLLWSTLEASRHTLKVTQDMAKETSRIGEAQTRAYIFAEHVRFDPDKNILLVILRNTENSPAFNCRVTVRIRERSTFDAAVISSYTKSINGISISPNECFTRKFRLKTGWTKKANTLLINRKRVVIVAVRVDFNDVFHRAHSREFRYLVGETTKITKANLKRQHQ